jgi:uncharacterized protein YdgA (DUF945 family)
MDFDTERHAVTVKHKDKDVTYYIRELGYYEFQELNQEAVRVYPDKGDSDRRGLKVLHDTAVASIEDKDGKPVFTIDTWKRLPKEPATLLTNAAMKAQGIDLQKASEEADEPAQEDTPGNA